MARGRLDMSVIGSLWSPLVPPGQGGRREGKHQEEGNKTSAHCRTARRVCYFKLALAFRDGSVTPYLAAERSHQRFSGQN